MAVSPEKAASFSLTLTPQELEALRQLAIRDRRSAAAWLREQIHQAWGDAPMPKVSK